MKTQYELKKEELAIELLKIHRDLHFNRIDHATSQNKIKSIMDKAKLNTISPNEILNDVLNNEKVYEKVLETKYKIQYSTDKPQNPNHII